jgi:hypothetical protein
MKRLPHPFAIHEALGGGWIVTRHGIQWGAPPCDRSGCSAETFPSKAAAVAAVLAAVAENG